jgi:hypothetical protein
VGRCQKFLRLTTVERLLLVKAALLLALVRVGLWLLPYRTVRRAVILLATFIRLPLAERHSIEQLTWAVHVARQLVPEATCLTQALALEVLLQRAGFPVCLRVGFAKGADNQVQGHAWVESGEKVVLGGVEIERYAVLPVRRTR